LWIIISKQHQPTHKQQPSKGEDNRKQCTNNWQHETTIYLEEKRYVINLDHAHKHAHHTSGMADKRREAEQNLRSSKAPSKFVDKFFRMQLRQSVVGKVDVKSENFSFWQTWRGLFHNMLVEMLGFRLDCDCEIADFDMANDLATTHRISKCLGLTAEEKAVLTPGAPGRAKQELFRREAMKMNDALIRRWPHEGAFFLHVTEALLAHSNSSTIFERRDQVSPHWVTRFHEVMAGEEDKYRDADAIYAAVREAVSNSKSSPQDVPTKSQRVQHVGVFEWTTQEGWCIGVSPRAWVREREQRKSHTECHAQLCSKQGKRGEFKACARCKTAQYCSRGCQKQDWPEHKKVCAYLLEIRQKRKASRKKCA
jgi:hypothetical protein